MNIFEMDSRNNYDYETSRGLVKSNALWSLPLDTTTCSLEDVAARLDAKIKSLSTGSILGGKVNSKNAKKKETLEVQFQIVKHIYDVRSAEDKKRLEINETINRRQRLLEAKAAKDQDKLDEMTGEDIQKELDALNQILAEIK